MNKTQNERHKRFSIEEDQPSNWFEPLYSGANKAGEGVPWANMKTHPSFARWLAKNPLTGDKQSALVVGCGMGDDATELESLGFDVTAFDVSETAINYCKERFPNAKVDFCQADLLKDHSQWTRKFDFVLEIFTVQALPPKYEKDLIGNIASFVAPGGKLLVVAEVGKEKRSFDNGPPWVLTPEHREAFVSCGLTHEQTDIEKSSREGGDETFVSTFSRTTL
ncbi:MAG: class I SAM-dependent methyltransferase [Parvibaculaceae bacterium]|nr:class I SAM-dependent methyltransferase [Parvibaculaceae bacterium]